MQKSLKKIFLVGTLLLFCFCANAQVKWPSAEIAQMYKRALEYMDRGDNNNAQIVLLQMSKLVPDNVAVKIALGVVYYREGDPGNAEEILKEAVSMNGTMDTTYYLLSHVQDISGKIRSAKITAQSGLQKFPGSGLLHHQLGAVYFHADNYDAALGAWLTGITKVPDYADNYVDAARVYFRTSDVLWGLLLSEMYLFMPHDTARDEQIKDSLFKGYKTFFEQLAQKNYDEKKKSSDRFDKAVHDVYMKLTPVVSDGITTDNLIMVRTRFLMEWFSKYDKLFSCTLFRYQDELIRNGKFEICNQWLFGKTESRSMFEAWNKFHEGDIDRFLKWLSANRYRPAISDILNNPDLPKDK